MSNLFFSGRIPADLLAAVEAYCNDREKTKTQVLIEALSAYVGNPLKASEDYVTRAQAEKIEARILELEKIVVTLQSGTSKPPSTSKRAAFQSLSKEEVDRIKRLRRKGASIREIARLVKVSLVTVCKYCKNIKTDSKNNRLRRRKTHILLSPTGLIYQVPSKELKSFCEENELSFYAIYDLWRGRHKFHKGWSLLNPEKTEREFSYFRFRLFHLVSPSGEICSGLNLQQFCKERGLDYTSMGRLRRGVYKVACGGWTVLGASVPEHEIKNHSYKPRKNYPKDYVLNKQQSDLVLSQLETARKIAGKYSKGQSYLFDDILQEILLKLTRAAFLYEMKNGASFKTYAAKWMKGAVMNFLKEHGDRERRTRHLDGMEEYQVDAVFFDAQQNSEDFEFVETE